MTSQLPRRALPFFSLPLFSFSLAFFSLALLGCGPSDAAVEPNASGSAGGETESVEAREVEVASGPVRTYIAETHSVILRLDMSRVRASAVSADIASLVRAYPAWQRLLDGSGLDPVRDFDAVLVTAETTVTDSATMLIVHSLGEARIREAVLQMAVDQAERPEWRQVDGFDVVDWPAETDPPRVVVIAGPRELLVTTAPDLDTAIAVAHDHRLRRSAEEVVEPALQLEDGVIATVAAGELSERMAARIEHPPESYQIVLRDQGEEAGRMTLAVRAVYADAAAAEAARGWVVGQRDFYAGQMLVRAVGLDRVLREANIAAEGAELVVDASFTEEEVQRVLGLLAFAQMSGG